MTTTDTSSTAKVPPFVGKVPLEGGNLGVFSPEEVGPMSVQVPNGTVDIAVEDEAEAVAAAKKYLSYFQGAVPDWRSADLMFLVDPGPAGRQEWACRMGRPQWVVFGYDASTRSITTGNLWQWPR